MQVGRRGVLAGGAVLAAGWPAHAQEAAAGGIAGKIALWGCEKIGGAALGFGVTKALGFLGLDPTGNAPVLAKLDEINGKLDQVQKQLGEINGKIDQLSDQITTLMNVVDIGLKQAYAQIDEASVKGAYGTIDRMFGSAGSASPANLFGLLHLPAGGKDAVGAAVAAFLGKREQIKGAIYTIHDQLAIAAGSSDPLVRKWGTLLCAKLHAAGPEASFEPFAQVLEGWFVAAVSQQLRAAAMLLFCDGEDAAKQAATVREVGALVGEECRLYLNAMERMALVWARPAPSGPTVAAGRVRWLPGTQAWLLRADVLVRALTVAFELRGPAEADLGAKLSGCYGRVLMRSAEAVRGVKIAGFATQKYEWGSQGLSGWSPEAPGEAELGEVTEFQGVDWGVADDGFGRLKPGAESRLRFARHFWPVPPGDMPGGHPVPGKPTPAWYMMSNQAQMKQMKSGWLVQSGMTQVLSPPRPDAAIQVYSLAELAPYVPVPNSAYLPFERPFTDLYSGPVLVVASFLDGWSRMAAGPRYSKPDAIGAGPAVMSGDTDRIKVSGGENYHGNYASADRTKIFSRFPLTFDPADWPKLLASESVAACFGELCGPLESGAQFSCAWDEAIVDREFTATSETRAPLFMTGRGEAGTLLLVLKGLATLERAKPSIGVWADTSVRMWVDDGAGTQVPVFDSKAVVNTADWYISKWDGAGTRRQLMELALDVPILLKPERRYALVTQYRMHISWDWNHGDFLTPAQPRYVIPEQLADGGSVTIKELGVVRAPGSGYSAVAGAN